MGWLKKLVGLFSAISWELPSFSRTKKMRWKKIETEPSEDYKNRSRSEWIYLHNRSFHIDFVYCAAVCSLCEQSSSGIMLIFREFSGCCYTWATHTSCTHEISPIYGDDELRLEILFWIFSLICVAAFQPCVFDEHSSDVHQSAAWHLSFIGWTAENSMINCLSIWSERRSHENIWKIRNEKLNARSFFSSNRVSIKAN